jgi:aerobic carbon-monoxide dehydrogenase small subunit
VNGTTHTRAVPVERLAVEVLREDLGLTGTKVGCDDGMCGACTILVDRRPVKSCLMLAAHLDASAVTTIEGLADGPDLHPVQQAMHERFAVQCGFCSPGFALTIVALLQDDPDIEVEALRTGLAGNICRCTGYVRIVDAARLAARRMRDADEAANVMTAGRDDTTAPAAPIDRA